jgi:hypothetical protein
MARRRAGKVDWREVRVLIETSHALLAARKR